ncbi:MAG: prepilin peptidase [Firmicutes bacterium]|nr:prepilin peptidase [Bacillota bacterium]
MNSRIAEGGIILAEVIVAIVFGVLEGNGAVYFFNKMPARWFCDYGETPTHEMLDTSIQRVKSHPWKYLFTGAFIVLNIKLFTDDWQFALAATCAIWLLLELSLADKKFNIVPDQLLILLAITAIGFLPFHSSWKNCLFGALIGFGVVAAIAFVGRLAYKRDAVGGGDIKLFAVLGLISGVYGIVFILATSALLSAWHFIYLIIRSKAKITDTRPMVPYIAIASIIYWVLFWGRDIGFW